MNKFKECNQCPYEFNDKNLEPCKDCVPKKKTNADRIRAMSDEELAEFLEKVISGKREVIGIKCGNEKCESWKCTECIQTWLQSEAE